jgi:hypothetical protein
MMLRLIGVAIVVLVLVAPVLVHAGITDNAGLLREFVDLETRFFVDLVDAARRVWQRFAG